jgi:hypothetical protein
MAQPTTSHSAPAQQQAPTYGVGTQGKPPVPPAPEPAKPVLFEDIDPVLLIRLYPAAKDAGDLRGQAMAAAEATHEAGLHLVASQQEPVAGAPEPPAPAHEHHDDQPRPRREA